LIAALPVDEIIVENWPVVESRFRFGIVDLTVPDRFFSVSAKVTNKKAATTM
jgi:hypothetical protein